MSSVYTEPFEVQNTWNLCKKVFGSYGINLNFPSNTSKYKTYQWRFAKRLNDSFKRWGFDENSRLTYLEIAAASADRPILLRSGLGSLFRDDFLYTCYNEFAKQDAMVLKTMENLYESFIFVNKKANGNNLVDVLLANESSQERYSNIVLWYVNGRIGQEFIAMSKACSEAYLIIDQSQLSLLPSVLVIRELRNRFSKNRSFINKSKSIMGSDWREPWL